MKSINQNAPVKCSKTIVINATPEQVWKILTNINEWSIWQKEINKSVLNGPLIHGSTFDWKTGAAKIHSTLHTVEPFREFGWTGKTFGMLAIHNWTLKELSGNTEVIVNESMEGFLATLFKKSFNRNLAKGMTNWLAFLKVNCEG
jgi:hypothetical protein